MLDHIFIWLDPTFPTPPSVPGRIARTYMGDIPRWEPMGQYLVKITSIQVGMAFISLKLIDGVPSHAKGV
jgi:hypothetical protein